MSIARTSRLLAGLLLRRFVNRFAAGFRRKKKDEAQKRTGTGRKSAVGWAGMIFIGVIFAFNGVNLTSQVMNGVRDELATGRDEQGRFTVSAAAYAELMQASPQFDTAGDPAARDALVRRAFESEAKRDPRPHPERVGEWMAHHREHGYLGFAPSGAEFEFLLPQLKQWHSPATAPLVLKMVGALVLLLAVAWLFIELGSGNQDLGKVEWTLEWLFTLPVPAAHLFLAQIFAHTFAQPLMVFVAWPMFATIFFSAGWGWWSLALGAGAAIYLSVLIASVRVALETSLRCRFAPPRLKNLQAVFTVLGMIALFLLIANVSRGPVTRAFLGGARELPDWTTWLPAVLPVHLCSAATSHTGLLAGIALSALLFPLAAVTLCSSLVRGGLVNVTGAYVGKRTRPQPRTTRQPILRGIVGKDLRLLLRDRNFLVQTLVIPVLIIGFQLVVNAGIVDAVRANFQHAAVLAYSVSGYVLIATALSALAVEGNSLWMLYTVPRSLPSVLLEKTRLWAALALVYVVAVLALCAWFNPALRAVDAVFAIVAMAGAVVYAFIAAGLGILATDPLEPELRRRVRPEMVQLYLLLAAMFAHALYAPSHWARFAQIVLSALLAFALWQKVRDRAPFMLDPVAAPPPSISLADGLIAALAFFVFQGLAMIILLMAKVPPGVSLFAAFVIAGALTVGFALLFFWRAKVRGVLAAVGLRRDGKGGSSVAGACGLGAAAGLAAAAVGWSYLRLVEMVPWLREMQSQAMQLPFDPGWWLPVLAVFAAPVFEEFIFRGLVFRGLRRSTTTGMAIVASAAIFAIVHPAISFVPVFVLGVVAAWSFERSRLLLAPILAHMIYNAAIVGMSIWK